MPGSRRAAGPTTPRPASRSSKGSRPYVVARACTSARPTSAASITSCGKSSTTRSTRRWRATPGRSSSRSKRTGRSSSRTTGGVYPSASTRRARMRSRSFTRCSMPAASSVAMPRDTRCPADSTVSASASSTPCRNGCGWNRPATASSTPRSTPSASRPRRSRRSGPPAIGAERRPGSERIATCSSRRSSRST